MLFAAWYSAEEYCIVDAILGWLTEMLEAASFFLFPSWLRLLRLAFFLAESAHWAWLLLVAVGGSGITHCLFSLFRFTGQWDGDE